MSPPPGGLTSRLLKPLIKHLTRQRRPLPSAPPTRRHPPNAPNKILEETKEFARDVWRSTFGGLEGGGGGTGGRGGHPAWETIPLRRQGRTLPGGRSWPSGSNGGGGGGGQYRDLHTSYHPSTSTSTSRLAQSTRFMATRLRPQTHPRGPALVGQPGLHPSPLRTFATYGAGAGSYSADLLLNVPLGLRALADRMRKDEDRLSTRRMRRKVIKMGRERGKVVRALQRFEVGSSAGMRSGSGSGSGLLQAAMEREERGKKVRRAREYKRFFVQDQDRVEAEVEVEQDVKVERAHVHPPVNHEVLERVQERSSPRDSNKTTYLLLPLAPSLSHLLSLGTPTPTAANPHHSANPHHLEPDIERSSYFHPYAPPSLLDDLLPTSTSTSTSHPTPTHAHAHLFPLLQGLSNLVTLSTEEPPWHRTDETVEVEYVLDSAGEAESMRLRFEGWSEVGVRGLVRRVLGEQEEMVDWYHVYEVVSSAPFRRSVVLDGEDDEEEEQSSLRTKLILSPSSSSSLFSSTSSLSGLSDPSVLSGSSAAVSSYAPTVISDHDRDHDEEDGQPTDLLALEEQTAWRMPVLTELGDVDHPGVSDAVSAAVDEAEDGAEADLVLASSVASWSDDEEMDLGWVEGRVWAD